MSWFTIAIALVLGLAFGSFLTVAIHRVPGGGVPRAVHVRGARAAARRSATVDNIPVISWLVLRGPVPRVRRPDLGRLPLTELACGGLFVAVALVYEDLWRAVLLAPFSGLLVAPLRDRPPPPPDPEPSWSIRRFVIAAAVIVVGPTWPVVDSTPYAGDRAARLRARVADRRPDLPEGMGMGDVKLAGLIGSSSGRSAWTSSASRPERGSCSGEWGRSSRLLGRGRKSGDPVRAVHGRGGRARRLRRLPIADAYLNLLT